MKRHLQNGEDDLQPGLDQLLISVDEVADLLQISRGKVYELIRSRELPSIRLGRLRRIKTSALHAWVDAQGQGGA